ncbi:Fanconi anemia group B protein-like [Actinia tenebrosa]|uniref:Fanconi anemia group B protein-like n=1 Tax=Actinia tenebrosa TaxID=6105 RepID=A0A6P8IZP6_ACTTE|nr:Fanconi anemia group B protein-like [Actinia tenebrosa]
MEKDISTHILTYRGKVLMVRHIENTDTINFTVHGYSKDTRQFVKQKERERQLGMEWPGIRVTGFECIVEYVTGIKQPCLLVENHCGRTEQLCLHLFFLVNISSHVKIASFNLCSSISRLEYKLNDGPCVSWLHRNCLEFLRWNTISKSLEHSSHICTSDELYSSLKLLWSGMMNDKLVAIATLTTETNKTEWLCIDFERGLVPSERILPSVYSSTALCCYVTDDDTVRQRIYIGTSMRQLIGFQQGKLVGHCQLPFDDPCHIISMETEEGSTYVMVQSKKNKVCAINCNQSKIVHEWSNKDIILIDDFLERGTDQLCLLQGSFRGE